MAVAAVAVPEGCASRITAGVAAYDFKDFFLSVMRDHGSKRLRGKGNGGRPMPESTVSLAICLLSTELQ